MPHDATIANEEDPNHIIIWLDLHIGDPKEYIHLKKSFSSQSDPKNETPMKLFDKDEDDILDSAGPVSVDFEGVVFLLAAFKNAERCIECFEENQHKRIFFITSGSMGQVVVPMILGRFPHVFTDSVTNESYNSIYIFCGDRAYHAQWALAYRNYVQIFDDETALLPRMVRDIADHFLEEGQKVLVEDPPKYSAAQHRLTWAHELYQRYGKMENCSIKTELDQVNKALERVESEMVSLMDVDN
ncbi:unnamed protein product [Adineta steineri]|uniref:Uncharacterized protein n=1 Tax=Adineta steineri TaxID=433720 RepID=A0A818TSL7_9BILA|nr:unnamed protein product [Adineta steineri]CAF1033754.1 unnamed protein product [Adineta steineri]CAF3687778.1 unnamed protein product [Adineta steineri]CAF3841281.1 unnamed protein product [Adineta steineri]